MEKQLPAVPKALPQPVPEKLEQAWRKGQCPENFNAESGLADDQPDTDLYYGWGALMPLIATLDISRLTPWELGQAFLAFNWG